jgi:hypothetical protein
MNRDDIKISDKWLALMCIFRYSLGRKTYMASHAVSEILSNWNTLDSHSRKQIGREILEHERMFGNLGDDCDRQQWYKIIDKIGYEETR